MRLAASYTSHADFLLNYDSSELDPHWSSVCRSSPPGWKSLVARETEHIESIRSDIMRSPARPAARFW